jgi:hypothetical protein
MEFSNDPQRHRPVYVSLRFRILIAVILALFSMEAGTDTIHMGAFSQAAAGGRFPDGWRVTEILGRKPSTFRLVDDGGSTVVRIDADASSATLIRPIKVDPAAYPYLGWRWRVGKLIDKADIYSKQGDDFPARLYVMFDYPMDKLSALDRGKLKIARAIYGDQVPAAALCYVWDKKAPIGTTVWNAYSDRVRMIVLRSGEAEINRWITEGRNIAKDFRTAFGEDPPNISGVAIAADTDQTGETATSWFGDILFTDWPSN